MVKRSREQSLPVATSFDPTHPAVVSEKKETAMIAILRSKAMRVIATSVLYPVLLPVFLAPRLAFSQTPAVPPSGPKLDLYTPEQLAQKAQTLRQQAEQSGTGSASVALEKYPGHYTMLAFRERSGGAELHKDYADIDVILDGTCTLIVGGTIPDAKTTGPGEVRGASVQGGESTTLHKGDILHIPANTPHQMMLPPGGTLTYFVIKALETGNHE
jgi:mannose-6-phosphate isomerase-like protein (cupin superfamily)